MAQITLWKSIKGFSSQLSSLTALLQHSSILTAARLCHNSSAMCSRGSCHSHETSCHESRSSCHDSRPSCHYIVQRQPVQKFSYVTPCCPPVQSYCPPLQSYCPPVQRYCPPVQPCCPPVQRYCPPVCPQVTKNICKLPSSYPKC